MYRIEQILTHLSKNILLYTLLIIVLGTVLGLNFDIRFLSNCIPIVVFLMIYPMMANISFKALGSIKKSIKPLLIAVFVDFLYTPFIYYLLCNLFNCSEEMKIGILLLSVAPASSMGLGYVGLSKGNMVSASVIVSFTFKLCLIVYPIAMHLLGSSRSIIPFSAVMKCLFFVLYLPLILGIVTREFIEKGLNMQFEEIRPVFSLVSLSSMYLLIFLIFATKGWFIMEHYMDFIKIAPIVIIFYVIATAFLLLINRFLFGISYGDNQAIVFTGLCKDVVLTIGLLTTAFGSLGHKMAMYPAIISVFQIIFLMSYLHLSERLSKWWGTG